MAHKVHFTANGSTDTKTFEDIRKAIVCIEVWVSENKHLFDTIRGCGRHKWRFTREDLTVTIHLERDGSNGWVRIMGLK